MTITLSTTPKTTDTKLRRFQRILQKTQTAMGGLAHNNPSNNDTRRVALVKILRSLKGV